MNHDIAGNGPGQTVQKAQGGRKRRFRLAFYLLMASAVGVFLSAWMACAELPEGFGIYISDLGAKNVELVAFSTWQHMTHPRVSPDGQWVTFTRYNKKVRGIAQEANGYEQTEIMIVRTDGSGLQTVVPAKEGVFNCDSSWADEGRALVFASTDNAARRYQIMRIDLSSKAISRVPTPANLIASAPHAVGKRLVFTAKGERTQAIWIGDGDGGNMRQITSPDAARAGEKALGDFEPRLSPDSKQVAFMRLFGKNLWRMFVRSLESGEERDLSGPSSIDIVPDWSSDGRLLIFSHIDTDDLGKMGIYTVRPDGTDRRMLPLPAGNAYNHPRFLPNSGSLPGARFVVEAIERPSVPASTYEKVRIIGDQIKNGVFDPSLEYDRDGTGWMAYSRVELPEHVETRLAKSSDRGKTWHFVSVVNESPSDTLTADGRQVAGAWRHEVSSLLYDPGDAPDRRWKLFSHRYFAKAPYKDDDRLFSHGWIECKFAAAPDRPWSEPVRLFGSRDNGCRFDLNSLHPDLRSMKYYSEIGSIADGGAVYVSLDASDAESGMGRWESRKVILVSTHDRGSTWKYSGTLTDFGDAQAFGYIVFTGTSLVKEKNRIFLLASPSGGVRKANANHDGTYVFEFEDLARARLRRDTAGKLIVVKRFRRSLDAGGLSDYDEQNTGGGVMFSQFLFRARPDVFQLFNSGERLASR